MKQYLDNLQQREPHERRVHAMRIAGVLTAVIFFGWITTLGLRYGGSLGTNNTSQTASTYSALPASGLEVSSSSVLSY